MSPANTPKRRLEQSARTPSRGIRADHTRDPLDPPFVRGLGSARAGAAMSIFKAYDIRGIYPDELDERLAYAIGAAVARQFAPATVAIGRDGRTSSPSLAAALRDGLLDAGIPVLDIGPVSTPMLYHFAGSRSLPLGLMVTASHNPARFNGLKLCQNGARPVGAEQIRELGEVARSLVGQPPRGGARASATPVDPYPAYCAWVREFARFDRRLRIAADTANAICGAVIPRVFAGLPLDVVPLYFELDGTFPNHEPDPLKPENTRALQEAVVANGCAFGAALDGDGDRVIFVDERGRYVAADLATILIALDVVATAPAGAKVVIDTRVTKAVGDALAPRGVEVIRTRVGHSFVKKTIHEVGGVFGGELSGHYYFRESFFAENSDLAIIAMVNLLARTAKPLSALVDAHRRYFQSGELNFTVANKAEALERVRARYADGKHSFIDGITIEYPTWWTNVRPSNTEDLLRLNVEADSEDELARRVDELGVFVRELGGTPR